MEKKSVVKSLTFDKRLDSPKGTWFLWNVVFDNGDKGTYFSTAQVQDSFTIGNEADYTIEQKVNGQYTNYIIRPQKKSGRVTANPEHENKRVALRCAVDLAIAGKKTGNPDDIIELAKQIYNKYFLT